MIEFKPKKQILAQLSISHTNLYQKIRNKKFPRPIKVGKRSVWLAREVDEVCKAWIAGCTDAEIMALVAKLELARKSTNA